MADVAMAGFTHSASGGGQGGRASAAAARVQVKRS